jgi:hypothetical protein
MNALVYFWKRQSATVSDWGWKLVTCAGCGRDYRFLVFRSAVAGGHAPSRLNDKATPTAPKKRAKAHARHEFRNAIEAVSCPICGAFQPDMVRELRRRHGKRFDPNKRASERVSIPLETAWEQARSTDTIKSYRHFIETWPVIAKPEILDGPIPGKVSPDTSVYRLNCYAAQAINDLHYPRRLLRIPKFYNKLGMSNILVWTLCIAAISTFMVILTFRGGFVR